MLKADFDEGAAKYAITRGEGGKEYMAIGHRILPLTRAD